MEQILLKEKINIPPKPDGPGEDGNGVFTFIYRGKEIDKIQERFGRKGCCVKIYKNQYPFKEDIKEAWWAGGYKGTSLLEAVDIQNIYSIEGLSPRVYAIIVLIVNGEKHWACLTEDLGHWREEDSDDKQKELLRKMTEEGEKYGIQVFNDGRKWNVINGKYVDVQGFRLTPDYKDKLKKRLVGIANIGKWGPFMNYHSIPELEISGGRDNEKRIKELHLDEIDFKGKTVLDIGCSEGFFCRYAMDRGAKRVLGLDLPGVVKPTEELTYFLGYNNIDYQGLDLKTESIQERFDIVLFLSMVHHVGLPDWVIESARELFVFEGNGKMEDAEAITKLNGELKDKTTDLFERPVIWIKK